MLTIMAATEAMKAAPRNSLIRKSRNFDSEVSIMTRTIAKIRTFTRIRWNCDHHLTEFVAMRETPGGEKDI